MNSVSDEIYQKFKDNLGDQFTAEQKNEIVSLLLRIQGESSDKVQDSLIEFLKKVEF